MIILDLKMLYEDATVTILMNKTGFVYEKAWKGIFKEIPVSFIPFEVHEYKHFLHTNELIIYVKYYSLTVSKLMEEQLPPYFRIISVSGDYLATIAKDEIIKRNYYSDCIVVNHCMNEYDCLIEDIIII